MRVQARDVYGEVSGWSRCKGIRIEERGEPVPRGHEENWNAPINSGGVSVGEDAADGILTEGEELVFWVDFPEYEGLVDVYVAVVTPVGSYFVRASGQLVPFRVPYVPYAVGVKEVPDLRFAPMKVKDGGRCELPGGRYMVCSLVVPAGTETNSWFMMRLPGELTCYSFVVLCH